MSMMQNHSLSLSNDDSSSDSDDFIEFSNQNALQFNSYAKTSPRKRPRPNDQKNFMGYKEEPNFASHSPKSLETLTSPKQDSSSSNSEDSEEERGSSKRKKIKLENSLAKPVKDKSYEPTNATKNMMKLMGFKEGTGLGKHAQGRLEPVEASKQRGRRGLGHHIAGLEPESLEWDFAQEQFSIEETVKWLDSPEPSIKDDISEWCHIDVKKLTLDDEDRFCDKKYLKGVLRSKSIFDSLESEEMRKARTRSNPFETIRNGIFLNRAAMKMANLDRITNFMFTTPLNILKQPLVEQDEPLLFADCCAGPGGFSEYVLWRRKGQCKGFGFTLKGENDFKLQEFLAGTPETFEPHYGENGLEGDGNIFYDKNIRAFYEFVMKETDQKGVHFMMADGGFSVEGQENIQEILSKRLYLCQCLVALLIVRTGGHFVCKFFDLFTLFSVGLIYLMYRCFDEISIHKPHTSRPANSERYLICKNKKPDTEIITNYLSYINDRLDKFGSTSKEDVGSIVPLDVIEFDQNFITYIKESNNEIAELQILNLKKIAAFCKDSTLEETRQAEFRTKCLEYWDVPIKARKKPEPISPENKLTQFHLDSKTKEMIYNQSEHVIRPESSMITQEIGSLYDWHCIVIGSNKKINTCTFFLGLGSGQVYKLNKGKWCKEESKLEISADTLIYGELVTELSGEARSQMKTTVLHIIDALFLAGIDIRNKHLTERHAMCRKFAKAHHKSTRPDLTCIKVKPLYDLEQMNQIRDRFHFKRMKNSNHATKLAYLIDENKYFIPGGLLFLKATNLPWQRFLSQRYNQKYYSAPHHSSLYDKDRPVEAVASFATTFSSKLIWYFDFGDDADILNKLSLSFQVLEERINPKINK